MKNEKKEPESVKIILSLPKKVLSPNFPVASRRMMFAKAAAIKVYRRIAMRAIIEERIETMPWEKVELKAAFYFKTSRERDDDNAMGSLKAACDGIVDAGLVVKDDYKHMKRMPPEFHKDSTYPRVEILITRVAG
ncbi:hypothetical protein LCGC14_1601630 [marine sediment metagenome]|uniref:Uncharacterized protein n=1 Tax=marine sediment metagenome TaxID=412755 RepID=A0A0F9IXK4_9ZZZZ